MQLRVFPREAWTDQLKKLLDVLGRMGLLGHVLRTTHVTGALCYYVSRTAAIEQPAPGAAGLLSWKVRVLGVVRGTGKPAGIYIYIYIV